MATRKRKSSKKRRTVRATARRHNPINPTRRRKRSTRRRSHAVVHARRRHNPIAHRRSRRRVSRRRHRNPFAGATSEILNFTVAGLAQGIAAPIVGSFASRFLPFGQFNAPIITLGTGWLLSKAFGMFGFTRRFSHPALVFGAAAAAMQVLQPIVARTVGGGLSGWGNGYARRPMVRGIGIATGVPPTITPPPLPPAGAQQNGMQGMGMRPGVYQ